MHNISSTTPSRTMLHCNPPRSVILIVLLISIVAESRAQGLGILSSVPADSSTDVPLDIDLHFLFDRAIDTTARSSDGLPVGAFIGPRDSLTIQHFVTDEEHTKLVVDVRHRVETDYVWIVSGAEGADTTSLDLPYVLRYTTSTEWGSSSVHGIVFRYWLVKRGDLHPDPRHVVVALLDEPLNMKPDGTFTGFDRIVAAVGVPNEDGEFTIDRVRNGTYWPVAFLDIDRNGQMNGEDRLATYGDHDHITVDGEDVDEVHIDMYIGGNTEAPEQPSIAQLGEIHPNPTRAAAQLELELTRPAAISSGVFNLLGQEVRPVTEDRFVPSGPHRIRWDASSLAAGVYIFRLQVDGATQTRLFIVMK